MLCFLIPDDVLLSIDFSFFSVATGDAFSSGPETAVLASYSPECFLLGRGSVDDTGPTAGRGGFSGFSGVGPDGGGGGSFGDAPVAGGTGAGLFFLRVAGLGLPWGGLKVQDLKSECEGSI